MAIGRMQMNRQLYGLGGYFPPENGREKFGLGSKLKKFARKIIPNEVSEIAVKAAPFVAPFNPLLAGAMAGIGGFDQTGRIGSSLKSGLLTYGGGQLGRYIGGAGFQQGINPFAGYNPASSFGGISSLFTSPIGTQTGLQLGQYEMFGGPGSGGDQATRKAIGEQIAQTGRDAAVPPGTFIDAGVDSGIKVADYTGELISNTGGEVAKQATRGYMDITKDLFSGDFTTMGNAAKELGGKALKDIYTTPITNQAGEVVGSKVDKTAVLATLSAIPSYLDAKKAADDAGIEEFDEATYNAERDKYMERYKANLPASSFGIQAAANGGRIGYGDGTKPSAEENTPSQEIINRRIAQIKDMSKRGADIDTIKSITGASDQMIKDVLGQANGGRIGYREGTPREGIVSLTDEDSGVVYRDPKTGEPLTIDEFLRRAAEDEAEIQLLKEGEEPGSQFISRPDDAPSIRLPEKGIRSLDTGDFENETKNMRNSQKLKSEYESDPYVTQLLKRIGTEAFFGGEPNPTSKYREFDKMSPEYQDRVETRREKDRRFFQQPGYGVHTTREIPRYDDYGMEMKAGGGRMGYMMGTEVPMRQNQGGITELDYRKTGGFVPVGVKERADDVPAMLSKNEFVFTADAVRGAGKGDINKGAKMMYAKMKALEGKVKKLKKTKKKKVKV
jgi:hypothetical protein